MNSTWAKIGSIIVIIWKDKTIHNYVQTRSGQKVYFMNPTQSSIKVEDIAYSLARMGRYNCHTSRLYSVAEHCLVLAKYVEEEMGLGPREVLTALHHDDSEYVLGDLVAPVKHLVPQFKEIEQAFDCAISARFDTMFPHPQWLKDIDQRIWIDERREFMSPFGGVWASTMDMASLDVKFNWFSGRIPRLTEFLFLRKHYQLVATIAGDFPFACP